MRIWAHRLAVVVLLAVLPVCIGGCGSGDEAGAKGAVVVKTAAAGPGQVTTAIEVVGALVPVRTANVHTKLSGLVRDIKVEVGDPADAGELLVSIDTKELQAQLEQARAAAAAVQGQAAQLKINLEAAQLAYERVEELAAAGAASPSQLDEARTRLDLAGQQYETAAGPALAQAQAAVNTIEVNMSNAAVYGPISGTVTNRNLNPGEMASPGTPLLTIADMSALKLEDTVAQEAVPLLAVGREVTVGVHVLPGREFTGRVSRVGPVAVAAGQRFPLEITLDNPGELKAGMTARAVFQLRGMEGIVIPVAAVQAESGQDWVFVVEDGVAKQTAVTLGLQNNELVTVLDGLDVGRQVAITNVGVLRDMMAVKVVE